MTTDSTLLDEDTGSARWGAQWATSLGPIRLVCNESRIVPRPSPGGPSPAGRNVVAHRFAQLLAETLHGARPVGQLRSVVAEGCLAALVEARRRDGPRHVRCVRVRAASPVPDVLDAVACYSWHPHPGEQARIFAVTFRLRRSVRGWRCIDLQVIEPGVSI